MTDCYTPEEFAQKLKLRGMAKSIKDSRDYVKQSGKSSFTEEDFEVAYRALDDWSTAGRHMEPAFDPILKQWCGTKYGAMFNDNCD